MCKHGKSISDISTSTFHRLSGTNAQIFFFFKLLFYICYISFPPWSYECTFFFVATCLFFVQRGLLSCQSVQTLCTHMLLLRVERTTQTSRESCHHKMNLCTSCVNMCQAEMNGIIHHQLHVDSSEQNRCVPGICSSSVYFIFWWEVGGKNTAVLTSKTTLFLSVLLQLCSQMIYVLL